MLTKMMAAAFFDGYMLKTAAPKNPDIDTGSGADKKPYPVSDKPVPGVPPRVPEVPTTKQVTEQVASPPSAGTVPGKKLAPVSHDLITSMSNVLAKERADLRQQPAAKANPGASTQQLQNWFIRNEKAHLNDMQRRREGK